MQNCLCVFSKGIWGRGGGVVVVPHLVNFGARWKWDASFTPRPLYSVRKQLPVSIEKKAGCAKPIYCIIYSPRFTYFMWYHSHLTQFYRPENICLTIRMTKLTKQHSILLLLPSYLSTAYRQMKGQSFTLGFFHITLNSSFVIMSHFIRHYVKQCDWRDSL